MNKNQRPVFLNLTKIRLPVTGIVSIFHRLSGLLLAFCIPLLIYLFDLSLRSPQGFAEVQQLLQSPLLKLVLTVGAWALSHHLIAGVRFLLIDIDIGILKASARRSAWMTHALTVLILSIAIMVIWL